MRCPRCGGRVLPGPSGLEVAAVSGPGREPVTRSADRPALTVTGGGRNVGWVIRPQTGQTRAIVGDTPTESEADMRHSVQGNLLETVTDTHRDADQLSVFDLEDGA